MNHWLILPILFPAFVAATQTLLFRQIWLQRGLAAVFVPLTLIMMAWMFVRARDLGIETYHPGHFLSPVGSVLVLDRLAITVLLLTNVLGLFAIAAAMASGLDRRQPRFHPLAQFLLMGLNGSYLAGDLFTLFLFSQATMMAAAGLLLHAGADGQKTAPGFLGVHLAALVLFIFAIGGLYGLTGTLTLADLAERASAIQGAERALLSLASLLLLGAFALTAGLFPVQSWLRSSLTAAPAAIAVLILALPTASLYAILRLFTQILPDTPMLPWLLAPALASVLAGLLGCLRAVSPSQLAIEVVLVGHGTMFATVALFTEAGAAAALVWLVQACLGGAALILLLGARQGQSSDPARPHSPVLFLPLLAGLALAGAPPFAGFLAQLMAIKAAWPARPALLIVPVLLVAPMICALTVLRQMLPQILPRSGPSAPSPLPIAPTDQPRSILPIAVGGAALMLSLSLVPFAFPVLKFLRGTALHLYMKTEYINAVLGLP